MATMLPENTEVLHNKALASLALGKTKEAQQDLEKILTLEPDNTPALITLVNMYQSKNTIEAALAAVQKQVSKSPDTAGHIMLLGNLRADNQQYDKAIEAFRKVQTLSPNSPQPFMQIARILQATGQSVEAIKEYKALLAIAPDYVPAILATGALHDRAGETELAKEAYRKVLEVAPNSAAAANNLAWLLTQEEDADLGEALRLSMIAKGIFPTDPHISDTLGWIHLKRESYSLAATQFQQAIEANPKLGTFKYHLALALKGDGKVDAAKEAITQALAGDDFPEINQAKELLNTLQ